MYLYTAVHDILSGITIPPMFFSHRGPPDYFKNLNKTEWVAEIGGMKTMLVNMAEIPVTQTGL